MAKIRKRFEKGITLLPEDLSVEDLGREGSIAYDSTDDKLSYRNKETISVTENDVADTLELINHTLQNDNLVEYNSLDYYVVNVTANDFQLSETIGGAAIDILTSNPVNIILKKTRKLLDEDGSSELKNKTIDASAATGTNTLIADSDDILYDNTISGMTATNVKDVVDEIDSRLDSAETTLSDHETRIGTNETTLADHETRIGNNETTLTDHETRIGTNETEIQAIEDSVGAANGIAPLDASSKIPATYLPSYVDDVEEYADFASLPVTGETGKIYVTLDNNNIYRWSGSVYVEIAATDDKANVTLNNLTTTSINQNLIPQDKNKRLGDTSNQWLDVNANSFNAKDYASGQLKATLDGGNGGLSDNGESFGVKLETEVVDGTTAANMAVQSRTQNATHKTGDIYVMTGVNQGSGDSGNIKIKTGTTNTGNRGNIHLDANQIDLNGTVAKNAADPVADQDLATKIYVDSKGALNANFIEGAPILHRETATATTPDSYTVDTAFNSNTTTTSQINDILIQSDGKMIVTGLFTSFNGNPRNRIVRLNPDGTEDTAFYTTLTSTGDNSAFGTSSFPNSSVLLSDDSIIIAGGGDFNFNGSPRPNIIKLNADGSENTTFTTNVGTGTSTTITRLVKLSDESLVVSSVGSTFNGTTAPAKLAKISSSGVVDTTWMSNNTTITGVPDYSVSAFSDNSIVLVDGTNYDVFKFLASGSEDITFQANVEGFGDNSGLSHYALGVNIIDDKVLIYQNSDSATLNGQLRKRLICLNSDGTENSTFLTNIGTGVTASVPGARNLINFEDVLLIGSDGTTVNGTSYGFAPVFLKIDGTVSTDYSDINQLSGNITSFSKKLDGDIAVGFAGLISFMNVSTSDKIFGINYTPGTPTAIDNDLTITSESYIQIPSLTNERNTIQPQTVTVNNNQVAYVTINTDTGVAANLTITVDDIENLPSQQSDVIIIARKVNDGVLINDSKLATRIATLNSSQSNVTVLGMTLDTTLYSSQEIIYKVKEDVTGNIRLGTLRVVTNGTDVAISDVGSETADTGVSFNAVLNGTDLEVQYSSGTNGAELSFEVKKIQ